jgi:hypothetical protein
MIVWKPLDVLGKRLYRVESFWRGSRSYHVVAADAPRDAAKVYLDSIGEARKDTSAVGTALPVGQPADWFEQQCISTVDCKHRRSETICSMDGSGPGFHRSYHVSICMDCGQITVHTMKDGKHSTVEFGLNCDWQLRAAAKYQRSNAEQKDAMARCAPNGSVGESPTGAGESPALPS